MVNRAVRIWLLIGVVMVFIQIIIGGVTRLTGSGLSITKWEIVTGTLPPLNGEEWEEAFDAYRATPQYQKINQGMSMSEFRFIYFWEYFHRLWARLMGVVFLIPLIWFLYRGMIPDGLKRRLVIVFLLAVLVASFGWIMVASGLVDRPWVNAYKLSLHLSLGIGLFAYLSWTYLHAAFGKDTPVKLPGMLKWIVGLFVVQVLLGGMMSGMKAGLYYPTWPDMYGVFIPEVILDADQWKWVHLTDYDRNAFAPAMVQFLHRLTAYVLMLLAVVFTVSVFRREAGYLYRGGTILFLVALSLQVCLGIVTVLECIGGIPVFWGVAHQAGAILVCLSILYLVYLSKSGLDTNTPDSAT